MGRHPTDELFLVEDIRFSFRAAKRFLDRERKEKWRQKTDVEGKPCGEKLLMYDYPQSGVTHIKVIDGGHGLGPAASSLKTLLIKMLGWSGIHK